MDSPTQVQEEAGIGSSFSVIPARVKKLLSFVFYIPYSLDSRFRGNDLYAVSAVPGGGVRIGEGRGCWGAWEGGLWPLRPTDPLPPPDEKNV